MRPAKTGNTKRMATRVALALTLGAGIGGFLIATQGGGLMTSMDAVWTAPQR